MAHYIITGNYTLQGIKGMVGSPSDREAAVRPLVEAAGGTLKLFLVTTGDSDFLMVVEGPGMEKGMMAALMVAAASGAATNMRTVQAFTSEEFTAMQRQAAGMVASYRPAG
jgi:uncharacterized protein with GYD domain